MCVGSTFLAEAVPIERFLVAKKIKSLTIRKEGLVLGIKENVPQCSSSA